MFNIVCLCTNIDYSNYSILIITENWLHHIERGASFSSVSLSLNRRTWWFSLNKPFSKEGLSMVVSLYTTDAFWCSVNFLFAIPHYRSPFLCYKWYIPHQMWIEAVHLLVTCILNCCTAQLKLLSIDNNNHPLLFQYVSWRAITIVSCQKSILGPPSSCSR